MDLISWGILACTIAIAILNVYKSGRDKETQIARQKELIEKLTNLVTGGDGYLYLEPSRVHGENKALLLLKFDSENPLYDVTVSIEEFSLIKLPGTGENYQYQKTNQESVQLGTVNPLRQTLFKEITLPPTPIEFGKRFFFSIKARNTLIEEDVYFRIEGEHYSQAYKVVTFSPAYERGATGNIGIRDIRRRVRHVDPMFPVHQIPVSDLKGDSGWTGEYDHSSGTGIHFQEDHPQQSTSGQ